MAPLATPMVVSRVNCITVFKRKFTIGSSCNKRRFQQRYAASTEANWLHSASPQLYFYHQIIRKFSAAEIFAGTTIL